MVYKSKFEQESYRDGDTRIQNHFAYIPKRIDNDMVWLQRYQTLQMLKIMQYVTNLEKVYIVHEWINLSHRII